MDVNNYKIIEKNEFYEILKKNNLFYFKKNVKKNDDIYINSLNNEIMILKMIKSSYVPKIVDYKENEFLITEWIDGDVLLNCRKLQLKDILNIILKLIDILDEIHNLGYIHCDVSDENIIYSNNNVFLLDFGNICKIGKKANFYNLEFSSLELIAKKPVNIKTDIYSVGVLLHNMVKKEKWFKKIEDKYKKIPLLQDIEYADEINIIIQKATNPISMFRYDSLFEFRNDIYNVLKKIKQ